MAAQGGPHAPYKQGDYVRYVGTIIRSRRGQLARVLWPATPAADEQAATVQVHWLLPGPVATGNIYVKNLVPVTAEEVTVAALAGYA